jgi:branched-chain amino acid transport system ATP-binding protein
MTELVVRNLEVSYGGIRAVRGITFEVARGELVGLVGLNGAGKSSTVRAIMGLTAATGHVAISNRPLLGLPVHSRAEHGIGFVPEGRGIFAPLSVRENLLLGGYRTRSKLNAQTLDSVCRVFPVLGDRLDQNASSLSGGEQQMLAVGRALMGKPSVLICDEPSMGLAPAICKTLFQTLRRIADDGAAVLVADQNAKRVFAVADEVCVMRLGAISARGTPSSLGAPHLVAEHYFGTEGMGDEC